MAEWMTNAPEVAAKLRAADEAYVKQREAARNLPLALKVVAYREASTRRAAAYSIIAEEASRC